MNKWVIAVIIVIIVLLGGFFFLQNTANAPTSGTQNVITSPSQLGNASSSDQTGVSAGVSATVSTGSSQPVTVTYTASGFSPKTVTIKKGESVTFVNNSTGPMWVASAPHPTHQGYSGTTRAQHCPDTAGVAFDECAAAATGGTYTFTFNKVGTWGYHNHAGAELGGTVVVTQ